MCTSSIVTIIIVAVIFGSYTIIKSRKAAAAAIEIPDGTTVTSYSGKRIDVSELPPEMRLINGFFDTVGKVTCIRNYSMSIDSRYRKKNHFSTYSKNGLLMETFTTCSLNDSTDEIENEIQIFLTKDEYLCTFTIEDTKANRHMIKTL